jgi:hypothetical protein
LLFLTLNYLGRSDTTATAIDGKNVVGYYDYKNGGQTYGVLHNGSTYTTIDPPGSMGTEIRGISGNTVVGTYHDSKGYHGFLYNGSTYTILDVPGGVNTNASAIDGNNVVGSYRGKDGFLYNGSTYTLFSPKGSYATIPYAISVPLLPFYAAVPGRASLLE